MKTTEQPQVEDVVVRLVDTTNSTFCDWGRDTLSVATAFCASPKWPAKPNDTFIAVDDWGGGKIVAAHHHMRAWIGWSWRAFVETTRIKHAYPTSGHDVKDA